MMKRVLPVLVILALLSVVISCSQNAVSAKEELVSVNFARNPRVLVSELEEFDKDGLYWFYAARKSLATGGAMLDGSGLKSGETTSYNRAGSVAVKADGGKGLGTVTGFSQGLWDFLLFGCKKSGDDYVVVYQGEATAVSLRKGGENSVNIIVSPVSTQGQGILSVDTARITFNPTQTETTGIATFTKEVTVTRVSDSQVQTGTDNVYNIDPGLYNVYVAFTYIIGEQKYIYAEGSVLSTVYSNLLTTVYGDLSELMTYAQFDVTGATYPSAPAGTMAKEWSEETGKWTITFTSTNPASVPTSYAWYVDSALQPEATTNTFVYTPGNESVNITCVFGNTSGTGSASVFIL